jgi:hypothetical protein
MEASIIKLDFQNQEMYEPLLRLLKSYKDGLIKLEQIDNSDHIYLFNKERHFLFEHQEEAVKTAILEVMLSSYKHSGYCFMPTSGGKSYVILVLAAIAVGDFYIFRRLESDLPGFLKSNPEVFPLLCNLSFLYSMSIPKEQITRTQILIHDINILDQLKEEIKQRLPEELWNRIQFHSVQSHRTETRRRKLKYLIIDECHWGNATEEETIQSDLVGEIKDRGGKAVGFTASPYENPDGKFQRTWSQNKINSDKDFNYYLNKKIIYPITLREVNLQNARIDFELGDDEIELTEKKQVVEFMAKQILTIIPDPLDGPAICYFSPVIIPEIVAELTDKSKNDPRLAKHIKVLGSDGAAFVESCRARFGDNILATNETIDALKKGEKIFLISQQKLLVGLNAPALKYCFISPTNSKIKILQGIGRLMRPYDGIGKKLAVLFLASLSGKKINIGEEREPGDPKEPCEECGLIVCDCPCDICHLPRNTECECPKANYTTTSLTLSEAYDLPFKVFYKTEVGFKDFINQTRINDPNTVMRIGTMQIPKDELDKLDAVKELAELRRLRQVCLASYKNSVLERDGFKCQGKKLLGDEGCNRGIGEVELNIHHLPPFEFADLVRKLGPDGVRQWHADPRNWNNLATLCKACHQLIHSAKKDDLDEAI